MPLYQCENGHQFLHAAKSTDHIGSAVDSRDWLETETYHCPVDDCQSINYKEVVEPQPEITSVLSCELGEVDNWLKQGYIVKELYAKTATLIKREAPKTVPKNSCTDTVEAAQDNSVENSEEWKAALNTTQIAADKSFEANKQ